jgi:hypothetical protein
LSSEQSRKHITEISSARVYNIEEETSENVISVNNCIVSVKSDRPINMRPNPRPIKFLVALPRKHAAI